ncbi:MAG TPA: hypothetical protein VLB84_03805, partial [Bacteroidia bacterium]|nr:hypothetical protein [Bacteroidia bacterium]
MSFSERDVREPSLTKYHFCGIFIFMNEFGERLRRQPYVGTLDSLNDEDFLSLCEIMPNAFSSISSETLAEFVPQVIEAESADVI